MDIMGPLRGGAGAAWQPEFTLGEDMSRVVQHLATVEEARALPVGSIVGDPYGGLTFSDAIAAVLEARSSGGWLEVECSPGSVWTIIVLSR
jgi:hypothetical protein